MNEMISFSAIVSTDANHTIIENHSMFSTASAIYENAHGALLAKVQV